MIHWIIFSFLKCQQQLFSCEEKKKELITYSPCGHADEVNKCRCYSLKNQKKLQLRWIFSTKAVLFHGYTFRIFLFAWKNLTQKHQCIRAYNNYFFFWMLKLFFPKNTTTLLHSLNAVVTDPLKRDQRKIHESIWS